ncbi:G-type lectin S-receptor-like serine/threonine-protein kinase [Cucumis melo var. makuwa]|uniref:non-specific serine/threonine protein kinase n=1 Tax=Cucumis melo var. makuwa TaxID=1194695 RepID=A0A5D3C7E2_CUCMM|nr:G-type lectin S-receptor-like serine/threonine-protein kinase [Cucumis melo var. makuwa]
MVAKRSSVKKLVTISWFAEHLMSFFHLYSFVFLIFIVNCFAKDTLEFKSCISHESGDTLVSAGSRFELGFFQPHGSSHSRRYLGIWYYKSNPITVVWVANRDRPLPGSDGVFKIEDDGNLKVYDGNQNLYWSTNIGSSVPDRRTLKLMDNGNLVLSYVDQEDLSEHIVWQSFDYPTDTFLPGMLMDDNLVLASWKSYDDPAQGNFTFQLDQDGGQYVIWKRSVKFWKSGVSGKFITTDKMPAALLYLLSNFSSKTVPNFSVPHLTSSLYIDTRLVLNSSGQLHYLNWEDHKVWSQIWVEPRDRCSVYNACGDFASCNSEGGMACKCLPGFEPTSPGSWNTGDYSGGCIRKSPICSVDADSDTFLSLKMMKAGNPDFQFNAKDDFDCKLECLNNCQCQAYSYLEANTTRQSGYYNSACWIWSGDLNNLQDEFDNGRDLNVRVAVRDLESTARNCGTCGTNLIPYPLSTGPKCGDPMYFNFNCNLASGQVNFEAAGGTYKVKFIDSEARKFYIQTKEPGDCGDKNWITKALRLNQSSPFRVTSWCNFKETNPEENFSLKTSNEVEISWEPPLEPICSSTTDCKDWPYSTCNMSKDGNKRCLCLTDFHWNGWSLNCTTDHNKGKDGRGKTTFSVIIVATSLCMVLLMILSCTVFYIYFSKTGLIERQESRGNSQKDLMLHLYDNERRVKDLIESGRFKEDDTNGIDIPFFDLESILVATDNFSNANKLGQGGFGPVYKGKFPSGQEIAVKRLSSGSGQGFEEFKNEVLLIAKLQHRNLVRLLGYCVEGDEKMLLYEYMPNKSLDAFIFDQKLRVALDWDIRFNVILGIARGLLYLHQDSRLRIIHRDLKTSNILLDEEMNPKISDFGLARIFGGKETATNTKRVVGTYGYMSPEYALDGIFSVKSDVFSFGVVVIEIISGKRNTGFYHSEKALSLLGYAWDLWMKDEGLDLMEQTLSGNCKRDEYLKCLNVGLLCVQEDPWDRPTMLNVVFMLGSETATLPSPKPPAFVVRRCPSSRASSSTKPETFSHNELTVTLQDGR